MKGCALIESTPAKARAMMSPLTADLRAAWLQAVDNAEIAAEAARKAWQDFTAEGQVPSAEQEAAAEEADKAWAQAQQRAVKAFHALFDAEVRINKDGVAERKSCY